MTFQDFGLGGAIRCAAALACLSLAAAAPPAAKAFTLEDALATAYGSNPRLEAARADVRAADERVAQAHAGWRPHIEATGSYGIDDTRILNARPPFTQNNHPLGGGVTLTQPVFEPSVVPRIRQAKAFVRANRQQMTATEQAVLLDAATAYLDVVRDTAVLDFSNANVNALRKQLDATQEQFRAGAVTRTDVSETQSRLAAAERQRSVAVAQLRQSTNAFVRTIGRPPENLDPAPKSAEVPEGNDEAIGVALRRNPILLQAVEQERAADFGVSGAIGQLLPRVSVQLGYRYDRDRFGIGGPHGEERGLFVTGQLTVPIYDGGASIAATREANQLHDRTKFAVVDAERGVMQAVSDAWQLLEAARAALVSSNAQVDASRSAVEGVRQEQQAGERQIIDILNAQQELFSAQVSLAGAEHDVIVASYRVLAAMGEMTAKDLRLNVKLYDPDEHYDSAAGLLNFGG